MKVALLVRSLERGGAERQLVTLAKVLKDAGVDVVVITFYYGGPFERDLLNAGIRVRSLHKAGRWDLGSFTLRFIKILRSESPDILYGFVVSPNLLASAVKPLFPKLSVVWGVRSARMDLSAYDWASSFLYKLEAKLSSLPALIIVNSLAGQRHLSYRGFPSEKVAYVPNGIDVDLYQPNIAGRAQVRQGWGVQDDEILVGIVGRADPVKAHEVFLAAAQLLRRADSRLKFVCVGVEGPVAEKIWRESKRLGIEDRLTIEPPRDGLSAVYSALDVQVMCSHSEGFPNVVAEGMACGTSCAVTDVGDAVEIVGSTGESVPPNDPSALSDAVKRLIARVTEDGRTMRGAARARIVERYSLDVLAQRTLGHLTKLMH